MRTVLFNRFFHPDPSATSQMVSDLAFELASQGHEVHAVASLSRPDLPSLETIGGVTVHRVGRATKPKSLILKALDYARYYIGARRAAKRLLGAGDVAIVKTDPPLLAAAIGPIAKRNGAILVNWLQDVFPEVAIEYGIPGSRVAALRKLRNRWLRAADRCVAISESMKDRLVAESGVAESRVDVIPNWARGTDIVPIAPMMSTLRAKWGLGDAFVVGYSGNLGRVHEFGTMLDAARRLRAHADIRFVVVGAGPQLAEVRRHVEADALANVQFFPMQERVALSDSLGLPDVHLCVLRAEFEGLVVPSKMYGIMAAGRPQLYIGDRSGEPVRILESNCVGFGIATGDGQAVAEAILALQRNPALRDQMGRNARALFDREFDFAIAARKWNRLLSSL